MGRDALPGAGDGADGCALRGGRLASMAPSVAGGQEAVQQGALDAARAAASGAGGGVCGALPGAGGAPQRQRSTRLRDQGVGESGCRSIAGLVAHARRQIDHVERRLLRGETIPHEEKVFSIFEEHTRWVSKAKAARRLNSGFLSLLSRTSINSSFTTRSCGRARTWTWRCRWCRKRRHCIRSYERAVSTEAFTAATIGCISIHFSTSMRCRGKGIFQEPTGAGEEESFAAARRAHPAIESAINGLEHRGLDRVRSHARTASRGRLLCRCWRPTCIVSGCFSRSGSAGDSNASPDHLSS